jgi:hypothetical protein|tara:strand:- start:363 stop:1112 length:750 start_codon:yes stop_codon:yes gene_type:complete
MPGSTIRIVLVVRYTPPDEITHDEVSVEPGDLVVVGRDPGEDGIVLYEADRTISRAAVELSEVEDGVRIRNRNRYIHVELFFGDHPSQLLQPREAHTLPGDGKVVIPDGHLIEFELSHKEEDDSVSFSSSETTRTHGRSDQDIWHGLFVTRRQVLTALVAAHFIDDFIDIPYRTEPTNPQLVVLCDSTLPAIRNRLDRARRQLEVELDQEFIGEHGRHQIAQWMIAFRLVTRTDVLALPGIDHLPRRSS